MSEVEPKQKILHYVKIAVPLILIIGALVGGYAIGTALIAPDLEAARLQVREEQDAHAATQRDLETARSRQAAAEAAVLSWRRNASALEARRRLSLAVEQLDARNFGLAQEHLRAAGAALEGANDVELSRLSSELIASTLELRPDVAAHRARALSAAHQIDEALTRLVAPDLPGR